MSTITVRGLDADIQRRLKRRAAANQRSMEAEVRAILSAAVAEGDFVTGWLDATVAWRGEEIPVPRRSMPRQVDLE